MAEIKFCSVCGSKVAESDQFCGSCGRKWVNLQKDDRIEVTATTKSLKDFLQEKRKDRQKFSLPRKSLGCHKVRPDAKPSHKIVDTSVIIEVGIMDMSKGNLEPVRRSRLPVKVGKDLEQYVLMCPDKKLVHQVSGTTEMFTLAKYKTELGKPFSKLTKKIVKKKIFSRVY